MAVAEKSEALRNTPAVERKAHDRSSKLLLMGGDAVLTQSK